MNIKVLGISKRKNKERDKKKKKREGKEEVRVKLDSNRSKDYRRIFRMYIHAPHSCQVLPFLRVPIEKKFL